MCDAGSDPRSPLAAVPVPRLLFELVSRTTDGVFAIDSRQCIVFWNRSARRWLGYKAAEVLGRSCWRVLAGTDAEAAAPCRRHCMATGAARCGKLVPAHDRRFLTKQGALLPVNVTTLMLPPRWRGLCLLIHLFRPTNAHHRRPKRPEARWLREVALAQAESAATPEASPLDALTPREVQVLFLLGGGASTGAIAASLGVGRTTVRTHIQHILGKLGVHNRRHAVALGLRDGLL